MLRKLGLAAERLLRYAYCAAALWIAFVYVDDSVRFHESSFIVAQAQAKALMQLAARLTGT